MGNPDLNETIASEFCVLPTGDSCAIFREFRDDINPYSMPAGEVHAVDG